MYPRHEDDELGYCPDCGCDLNPLGWFVMHKPDCVYRAVSQRLEDERVKSHFQDLHLDDTYNPRSIHWMDPRERAARTKNWRYDHRYKWSASGPECGLCGSVHEPNREPEGEG
jgi:hypothetical protein